LKRGYARSTIQVSEELRAGLIDRATAIELASQETMYPINGMNYYRKITGLCDAEIESALINGNNPKQIIYNGNKVKNAGEPYMIRMIKEMKGK
jgi:hypothetical protein